MSGFVCRLFGHRFSEWRLRSSRSDYAPISVSWTWFRACSRCGNVRAIPLQARGFVPPTRFPARIGPFMPWGFWARPSGTVADLIAGMTASGELRRSPTVRHPVKPDVRRPHRRKGERP